jgi:AcrR family transcriptional regulator
MTTTKRRSDSPAPARPLRRDAQRNRDAILAAARQAFCDHGLEAPLEEIARSAGVGIGTLYRHFPSRVALLDAVLADTVQAHVDAAEQALAADDPWEGFTQYLEAAGRLQAANRGLNDAMGMRFPNATALEAAKNRLFGLVEELVRRAQASGQLRADLTPEDLAFLNWANARIMQATRAAGAPDAWRRHLDFLLDGFRAERAHPLSQPPLSPRQVHRAMLTLGRRPAGDSRTG